MKLADEVMENFNDGSHILYVNSAIQDDTELGRLMHDLTCRDPDKMYSPILAERVRELKETQKGVEIMCREMDKIFNEGVELGEERGFLKAWPWQNRKHYKRAFSISTLSVFHQKYQTGRSFTQ